MIIDGFDIDLGNLYFFLILDPKQEQKKIQNYYLYLFHSSKKYLSLMDNYLFSVL